MLRREAEWPSNKNILIADTIWQNQALSQVLWFWGQNTFLGVKDLFYHMVKKFSEHNKICWGTKKVWG